GVRREPEGLQRDLTLHLLDGRASNGGIESAARLDSAQPADELVAQLQVGRLVDPPHEHRGKVRIGARRLADVREPGGAESPGREPRGTRHEKGAEENDCQESLGTHCRILPVAHSASAPGVAARPWWNTSPRYGNASQCLGNGTVPG